MARIVIRDLTESTELDRQAMRAISGGSRLRAGAPLNAQPAPQRVKLFDPFTGAGTPRNYRAPS
ncbi:MAG: hypothetical protein ABIT83_09920 [Massilia sp.]